MMFHDKQRLTWRVQWTDAGRRRSKSFPAKGDAERFEARRLLGELSPPERTGKDPTFHEFSQVWFDTHCKGEKAESQWRADEVSLRLHLNPALGHLKLSALRRSHLLDLRDVLRQKTATRKTHKLSPKSVNLILSLAKKIAATAVERELLPANPFAGVKLLRLAPQRFRYWTVGEREKFLAVAHELEPAFATLVLVACHTGLRLGELAALARRDVDFDRHKVRVSKTWDVNLAKMMDTTKGRTDEDVAMNTAVLEALAPKRFLQADAPLFDRAMFWSARKRLGRLAERADVPPIRFHDLRHTFASTLAMAGVDLMTIQRLMRHKSYAMTLRYAHLHPDHLSGATEVLCTQNARAPVLSLKSGGPTRT